MAINISNMIVRVLGVFSIFLWQNITFAQSQQIIGERVDCIYPSKEGMALIKSIERQPSPANGIPNIFIPIYSLPSSPLSLGLSYNTSGILVDEIPTIAGLGWRLESGGMITRVVMGIPDDYTNGFLNRSTLFETFATKNISNFTADDVDFVMENISSSTYDDSPDIFYYDLLGLKGKFILSRDGKVYCFPKNNIKFSFKITGGKISSFTAKLPNGEEAYFGVNEEVTTNLSNATTAFNSSWLISSIQTQNHKSLVYSYAPNSLNYTESRVAYDRLFVNSSGTSSNSSLSYTASFTMPLLNSISTATTLVNFEYNLYSTVSNFCTINSGEFPLLENIRVYFSPNAAEFNSEATFTYNLTYAASYVTQPTRQNLHLTSFNISVPNVKLSYNFDYYTGTLPNPDSKKRDLWGYSNGVDNTNIIPTIYSQNGKLNYLTGSTQKSGANRSANLTECQAEVLKSIVNPDGLKTEYIFGLNTFQFEGVNVSGNGLRVETINQKKTDDTVLDSQSFQYFAEGSTSLSSGRLLYHIPPAIGIDPANDPIITEVLPENSFYVKASYLGSGPLPYFTQAMYGKVAITKQGLGGINYYYEFPVERANSSIIPQNLSWINSLENNKLVYNTNGTLYIYNDSYPNTASLFNIWNNPLLLKTVDYDNTGHKVKEIELTYGPLEYAYVQSGLKLHTIIQNNDGSHPPVVTYSYHASKSYLMSSWRELRYKTETVYPLTGTVGTSLKSRMAYIRPDDGLDFSFIKRAEIGNTNESTIVKYKYCFESDFNLSSTIEQQIQDAYNTLESCLRTIPKLDATLDGYPSTTEAESCYNTYDSYVNSLVSDEVNAIQLLKKSGEYSTILEETNMLNKNGVKTVVGSSFSKLIEQENRTILPIENYALIRPIDSTTFVNPSIVYANGNYSLSINTSQYKKTKTVTSYNAQGNVTEYYGEDGVHHATTWSDNGMYPLLQCSNCTYSDINGKTYVQAQQAKPSIMLTDHAYLFPFGLTKATDVRGRSTYYIYNTLGEVVAVRDHDKNLRAISLERKKNQDGDANIVVATDPNGDESITKESVSPETNFLINNQILPNGSYGFAELIQIEILKYSPSNYTYEINYGDGSSITNSLTHKYNSAGTYTITCISKKNGTQVGTYSRLITLEYTSLIVSEEVNYSYDNLTNYTTHEFPTGTSGYIWMTIREFCNGGVGSYTIKWNVTWKEHGTPTYIDVSRDLENIPNNGGSSIFHCTQPGIYNISCVISDGVSTITKTYSVTISPVE